MPVTTARQKILAYLYKFRTASVREISRGLNLSPATVRHHLRVLTSDGRVEVASRMKDNNRRGRPEKIFTIPRAALGDNLSALTEAIWREAKTVKLEALAKLLAGGPYLKDQPVAKRLQLVIERLIRMKYHARWEAGSGGPRIIFGHCPYAAILAKRPELCLMDAALLEEMMGDSAESHALIRDGSVNCVFSIGG